MPVHSFIHSFKHANFKLQKTKYKILSRPAISHHLRLTHIRATVLIHTRVSHEGLAPASKPELSRVLFTGMHEREREGRSASARNVGELARSRGIEAPKVSSLRVFSLCLSDSRNLRLLSLVFRNLIAFLEAVPRAYVPPSGSVFRVRAGLGFTLLGMEECVSFPCFQRG